MSSFRNVQNDGVWQVGGDYTFETYFSQVYDYSDPEQTIITMRMLCMDNRWTIRGDDKVFLLPQNYTPSMPVYTAPNWAWTGLNIAGILLTDSVRVGNWYTLTATIPADAALGTYSIISLSGWFRLGVAECNLVSYEVLTIRLVADPTAPPADLTTYPEVRPDAYDPDFVWVPGAWVGGVYTPPAWGGYEDGELIVAGGGRYNKQLIALGHNTIYFEALN